MSHGLHCFGSDHILLRSVILDGGDDGLESGHEYGVILGKVISAGNGHQRIHNCLQHQEAIVGQILLEDRPHLTEDAIEVGLDYLKLGMRL